MKKYQNKYRISSARMSTWNYGWNGAYFVTICTAHRKLFFGNIVDGEMKLSETGKIAHKFWLEIPEHFPFVKLDVHVVMPNHIHGIVGFDKTDDGRNVGRNVGWNAGRTVETPNLGVSTTNPTPPPPSTPTQSSSPSPPPPPPSRTAAASEKWKPESLGSIINQYKRICTINARKINADFAWQSRFHDHIIRNNAEYQRIKNYIIGNPKNWNDDTMNA